MKATDLKNYGKDRLQEISDALKKLEQDLESAPTISIENAIKLAASQLEAKATEIYLILDHFEIPYKYIQKFNHGKFITK